MFVSFTSSSPYSHFLILSCTLGAKRTSISSPGSERPEKAMQDKESSQITREEQIWGHNEKGIDEIKFRNKRGRKRKALAVVRRAVPLLPRPEGAPVPGMLLNGPCKTYTSSNAYVKTCSPGINSSMLYPRLMVQPNQVLFNGSGENSQKPEPNANGETTICQRSRNATVMFTQNIPTPLVQSQRVPNALVGGNKQGNQERNDTVTGDPRFRNFHISFPYILVQVPNFVSSTPQYLWQWIVPDRTKRAQSSNPHRGPIPSWAVGRPLCLQLSRTEIGEPLNNLHPLNQVKLNVPYSLVPFSLNDGSISRQPQVPPPPLPQQSDQPYEQQDIRPMPLDHLTSFVKVFRSGFRMWPNLSLSQIRDKNFLCSCKDKNLLRLISRYLLEHALDQIARCDPSSELEPKWLMIPKNLYMSGSRSLLRENDRQKGFRCSCKSETEENRSGRYGTSCSDERCENRAMNIECVPGMCGAHETCKNIRLQRKEFPFVVLQKFPEKGFGLIACEAIRPGTMIGEYLGEILTEELFEKRMVQYQGEHHFYFMVLTSKLFIDASRKAGITRFINHSCDPNCIAEKWNAGGKPHVAIVARREIKPLEEITFSYQAQPLGDRPTKCQCGSTNCCGWLTASSVSEMEDDEIAYADKDSVVTEKVKQAHSDILLAEEILQRLGYNSQGRERSK